MAFGIHQYEFVTGTHVSSHPESPFHLPPRPIPLGCPRALALGALLHASNLHWPSILHKVMYMFQCYSLNSPHPNLLPLPTKVCLVKAMVFPVVTYGWESWTIKKAECRKNWCFWTVMLEKTLESPLDCKEIQPVHPKGDQSWVFIGRTYVEAETPILWPPDAKSWLIGKDPDAGKDWGQEKGMTEDEMVGWHRWLNGHGFRWTLGVGDGQGGLACCSSWGCKELDMTERLNWTELNLLPLSAKVCSLHLCLLPRT